MASREELLQSIRPDMKLDRSFFMRIYGYELTTPGFAEKALSRLEIIAGCSRARGYYAGFTAEYISQREKELKDAASWYTKELRKRWEQKEGEERRIQRRMLQILQNRY